MSKKKKSKTQQISQKLQDEVKELTAQTYRGTNKKTVEELKKTWEPVEVHLESIIRFGKYKDKKIVEILEFDIGWILWAFKNKVIQLDKSDPGLEYFTRTYITNKHKEYLKNKIK